jgi:2-succinyl-5-enolpyruvyl-6-hydroxy-3-cyclohexene-1-carboxylate synthase
MTHACLAPGSRSTPLALALAGRRELNVQISIDERSAGFMALGIAKHSRRPVAVLTTSGTATANLYPAVVEALYSQVPLMALTADRPPELRETGAGQTIDQIKLYGDYVKWFWEMGVAENRPESVGYWRSVASRAWYTSRAPGAGPVHLNFAFREPFLKTPDEPGFDYDQSGRPRGAAWTRVSHPVPEPSDADLARLSALIESTERGVIAIGTCDVDAEPVVELAAAAGWPLLAEATSNARIGAPAISTYDALLRDTDFFASHRPELAIRMGSLGTSKALNRLLDSSVRQVWVGLEDGWLDPRRVSGWIIRCDPAEFSRRLVRDLSPRRGSWLDGWMKAEEAVRTIIDWHLERLPQVCEPRVARDLAGSLPDGATLVVGSSMPIRDLDWFMQPRKGLRILANRGANGIDGFVSTCTGVAVSAGRLTFGLTGDLGLIHDANGFLNRSSQRIDLVMVVLNNDGGGIFSFLPQATHPQFERLFATPHGLDIQDLARLYRCGYTLLEPNSELKAACQVAAKSGGLQIIEARTDRRLNVEIHRQLWEAVSAQLRELK